MAVLRFKQGDSVNRTITIKDSDSVAVDITGGTVKFCIKKALSDTDGNALFLDSSLVLSDPSNGQCTLEILKTETALISPQEAFWQVEYTTSGGVQNSTDHDTCIIEERAFDN